MIPTKRVKIFDHAVIQRAKEKRQSKELEEIFKKSRKTERIPTKGKNTEIQKEFEMKEIKQLFMKISER